MNVDGAYSWLVKHAPDLAQFLNNVNTRDDVGELIMFMQETASPEMTRSARRHWLNISCATPLPKRRSLT
jgi:hypothetical protein